MAHLEKFTKNSCWVMFGHYSRDNKNMSNPEINSELTKDNYNLADKIHSDKPQSEILNKRLSEVKVLNRADVNVMCDWVVTVPKNVPKEDHREFFKNTFEFLNKRYGEKNVISAFVHNDEVTPHMHYSFVPVTIDKKKNIEKVCANDVITRKDLQNFHKDLGDYLEKEMGYKIDILNGATKDGNKSIKELKINTHQKEIEKLNLEIQNKRHLLTNLETKISRQLKLSLSEEKPPERKFLGSRDIVTLDYDEYLQDRKKFEKVKKKFTNLSKVNDNLKIDNAELFDKVKDVIKENEYLKNQPYSLNINYLRKKNNELEQTLEKKEI